LRAEDTAKIKPNRIKAVDSGAVVGISYQDVMLEAEKRLIP
jgi:hypothetical protein